MVWSQHVSVNSGSSPEETAFRYIEQLRWPAYPFQEQAIYAWFEGEDGLMVCAPTGSGKTVVAETAMFEALVTGRRAYYTTPLIALTDQKFQELQESAVRWGFTAEHVGLVTGNRKVNPNAPILVVVAEILLNRLLSPEEFSFSDVSAVVMDEFHSFNDLDRGIVWELSLALLPKHCRVLLISATVGNAADFVVWLNRQHGRRLRLLQNTERRVPLDFRWIGDEMLPDQLEIMADGEESSRYTPALVFCFNRNECWSVAEQLKGKRLLADGQQKALIAEMDQIDWSVGAGGKLRQLLIRGIGIHHAGLLPRYRRAIEKLFQKKLLSICVCTETLAAGINLPARSVVMTSLLKGPPGRMKLIDSSSAHQMFGRAGRPQFDNKGFVFAVAHEDDVKLVRWQEKYDSIPEDTRDPMLIRAKKNLKKKMPKRREGQQYWSEKQFQTLREASPVKLSSRGRFPWRLLTFFIRKSGTVESLTDIVRRRLLDSMEQDDAELHLKRMLVTLESAGLITLDPPPNLANQKDRKPFVFGSRLAGSTPASLIPKDGTTWSASQSRWTTNTIFVHEQLGEIHDFSSAEARHDDFSEFGTGVLDDEPSEETDPAEATEADESQESSEGAEAGDTTNELPQTDNADDSESGPSGKPGLLGRMIAEARTSGVSTTRKADAQKKSDAASSGGAGAGGTWLRDYEPRLAMATDQMPMIFAFRSVHPVYALYIAEHLHRATYEERLQLLEAIMDMPRSVAGAVRVPFPDQMPPGPLATEFLDRSVMSRGLVTQDELTGYRDEETGRRIPPLTLADKMLALFRSDFPTIDDVQSTSVWCVGELLRFGGNFDKYVRTRDLTKQEGVMFRHCLRMILLCGEFSQIEPPGMDPVEWRNDLSELASILTESCRAVDPTSTDEVLEVLSQQSVNPNEL